MTRSLLALLGGISLAFAPVVSASQLLELLQSAAQTDPVVAAARADADAQFARSGELRANILPQINATGSLTRNRDKTENATSQVFQNAVVYSTNSGYGVRLTQPLFNGVGFARFAQVDDQQALALANRTLAEQDLILRVAQAYFDWQAAHDNLQFAQAELTAIKRALEQAEVRFEVGLSAITDKQEAQARFDLARSQELAAAAELRSRRQAIRVLTGTPAPDQPAELSTAPLKDAPAPGNPAPWVSRALEDNLSLRVALHQEELARLESRAARAGHLPTLDLVAEHSFADTSDAQFGRETTSSQATLQLSMPLFSGGAVRSRAQQADAQYRASAARAESARRNTEQATRDAYDGVVTGQARVNALIQAVRSAQTARDAVAAGLEVGTRTNVDLLDAERELFGARRDLARARYDYLLSVLRLEQAAGSLDVEDLARIAELFT